MLRSILIGLDGSTHSLSALGWAVEHARRNDALLVGRAVIDEPTIAATEAAASGNRGAQRARRWNAKRLQ